MLDEMRTFVVRIATLSSFRDQKRFGPEKGDDGEGTGRLSRYVEHGRMEDLRNDPVAKHVLGGSTAEYVVFENIEFGARETFPDLYVFCATRHPSRKALRDFGCDACVEISNPGEFFAALTRELLARNLVKQDLLVGPCV